LPPLWAPPPPPVRYFGLGCILVCRGTGMVLWALDLYRVDYY